MSLSADCSAVDARRAAWRRASAELHAYVWGLVGDRADAAAITAASLARAERQRAMALDGDQALALYRVATALCLRALRPRWGFWTPVARATVRIGRLVRNIRRTGDPPRAPEEAPAETLRRALDALPPLARAALLLRECQRLRYDEIGSVLGVSRDKIARLLYTARCQLRSSGAARERAPVERALAGQGEREAPSATAPSALSAAMAGREEREP